MTVVGMKSNTVNVEAEQMVLGSLMLKGSLFDEVSQIVSAEDFYQKHHAEIFRAIEELAKKGIPRETKLVDQELIRRGKSEQCGGEEYLIELAMNVGAYSAAPAYARLVDEHSKRRRVIAECGAIAERTKSGEDIEIILDELGHLSSSLVLKSDNTTSTFWDIATSFTEQLISAVDGELPCFSTGFKYIDIAVGGGLFPGELTIIAGRPGSGKTTFATNIGMSIARENSVLIQSMEMTRESLFGKAVSNFANVPVSKFRRRDMTPNESERITPATIQARKLKITVDEGMALNATTLISKGREFKRENPDAALVVIDYLQLMDATGDTRSLALGEITRTAKRMAKELGLHVILLSQLNREIDKRESRMPRMSDLRDSGSIEQDADIILAIHRPHAFDDSLSPEEALACLIKNRNGEQDIIPITFKGQYCRFEDHKK